jgi:hypothetical protein
MVAAFPLWPRSDHLFQGAVRLASVHATPEPSPGGTHRSADCGVQWRHPGGTTLALFAVDGTPLVPWVVTPRLVLPLDVLAACGGVRGERQGQVAVGGT